MSAIEKYKKLYPSKDGEENLVVNQNGKLIVPIWLMRYLIHSSGLKSKKKRIVKKILKKQLTKILQTYVQNNG